MHDASSGSPQLHDIFGGARPVSCGRSVAIDRVLGSKRRKCTALCLALCSYSIDGSLLTRLALRYYTTYLCACTSTMQGDKRSYVHDVHIAFWKGSC